MIKKSIYRVHKYLITVITGLSICLGLLLLVIYLAIGKIQLYQTELLAFSANQFNAVITLDELSISWQNWQPLILIDDLEIVGQDVTLAMHQVALQPDILASIIHRNLQFDHIAIDQLHILADPKSLFTATHPTQNTATSTSLTGTLSRILHRVQVKNYLHVAAIQVGLRETSTEGHKKAHKKTLTEARLTFFSKMHQYQMQLSMHQNPLKQNTATPLPGHSLQAIVRIPKNFSAKNNPIDAYIQMQQFDLASLLHDFLPSILSTDVLAASDAWDSLHALQSLQGTAEFWYAYQSEQHMLYSRLHTEQGAYTHQQKTIDLPDLDMDFVWIIKQQEHPERQYPEQKYPEQKYPAQRLWLRHLELTQGTSSWRTEDIKIALDHVLAHAIDVSDTGTGDAGKETTAYTQTYTQIRLSSDQIRLHDSLFASVPAAWIPPSIAQWLQKLQPRGQIQALYAQAKLPHRQQQSAAQYLYAFAWEDMHLAMDLQAQAFSLQGFSGIPAIADLDARISMHHAQGVTQGRLAWNDPEFSLWLPELYSEPWLLQQNHGAISWQIDAAQRLHLSGHQIQAQLQDTAVDLDLSIHTQKNMRETAMQLQVGFDQVAARQYTHLLPDKILGNALRDWLDQSVQKGHIQQGTLVYNGALDKTARPESRSLILGADLKDVTFRFDPSWPAVSTSAAEIFLDMDGFSLNLPQVRFGSLSLDRTKAGYKYDEGKIHLDTKFHQPVVHLTNLIQQLPSLSSINAQAATAIKQLTNISGNIRGHTIVDFVPETRTGQHPYQNTLQLHRLDLHLQQVSTSYAPVRLTDLSGRIHYDVASQTKSVDLQGMLNQQPFSIRERYTAIPKAIAMIVDATLPQSWVYSLHDSVKDYFHIAAPTRAYLEIDWSNSLRIALHSTLQGIAWDIPAPLAKKNHDLRWLEVMLIPGQKSFTADYYQHPNKNKLLFSLHTEDTGNTALPRITAKIPALNPGQIDLHQIELQLTKKNQGYDDLRIHSDRIQGQIKIQPDHYEVVMDQLILPKLHEQKSDDQDQPLLQWLASVRPGELPRFSLQIKNMQYGNKQFRNIYADFVPQPEKGLYIEKISLQHNQARLSGAYFWSNQGKNSLQFLLEGQDVDKLFGSISAQQLNMTSQLNWDGLPIQPELNSLTGSLGLDMQKGHIISSENGLNTLSVLGLLNINTLFRRLRFDFSDLTESGLAFDTVSGKANIEQGVLIIHDKFSIAGPSITMEFSGSSNLVERTLDQRVAVILPLSQSLPLTSILIGVPQVAIPIWLSSIFFSGIFQHFSGATYSITGSFDEPALQLEKLFDTNVKSRKKHLEIDWEPK